MNKQQIELRRIAKYLQLEERIEQLKQKYGITGDKQEQKIKLLNKLDEYGVAK